MVTKPTGGGRPKGTTKLLRQDPERYVVAYFIARWNLFTPRPEPIKLARVLMQIHHAKIDDRRGFVDALAEDRKVRVDMRWGRAAAATIPKPHLGTIGTARMHSPTTSSSRCASS